ncbi:MAG: hypothetical protein ACPGGK_04425 [Pikeienuella sp.]
MLYILVGFLISANLAIVWLIVRNVKYRKQIADQRAASIKFKRDMMRQNEKLSYFPSGTALEASYNGPLGALFERARTRRTHQREIDNLLPPVDVDLKSLRRLMPEDVEPPEEIKSRQNMKFHDAMLRYRMRGQPESYYLNALAISYLRRRTPFNAHATKLFHRLWSEEGEFLIPYLNARWAISTLQTFYDFGQNEHQKLIGAAGYVYGNMLKIYEVERKMGEHPSNETYKHPSPINGVDAVKGLYGFALGRADISLNLHTIMAEMTTRDPHAGPVLLKFLELVQDGNTVFQRMDANRIHFEDQLRKDKNLYWSFNVDPRDK